MSSAACRASSVVFRVIATDSLAAASVLEDIAGTIGAHPTPSEAIHEAALGA
jgi:pyruvate/2-oxoglutarate dehydrogenase complex dihydrolipoamide dehydrogenase (E3) component